MCCFVILLLSNEMQMSVRRFSAIPHLRDFSFPFEICTVRRLIACRAGVFYEMNACLTIVCFFLRNERLFNDRLLRPPF